MENEIIGSLECPKEIAVELRNDSYEVIVNLVESGAPGKQGVTFIPSMSADGVLSWTNDGGLPNPDPVDMSAWTDKEFDFVQRSSADVWEIEHDLGKMPSVTVVDSGGNVVVGEVSYLSASKIVIKFAGAFSGMAYLN